MSRSQRRRGKQKGTIAMPKSVQPAAPASKTSSPAPSTGKGRTTAALASPPKSSPNWPAILSGAAVLGVLALLGLMLFGRSTPPEQAAAVADDVPAAINDLALQALTEQALAPTATASDAAAIDTPARRLTFTEPPPMTIDPSREYIATITTPRGEIVAQLRPDLAPQTVNSFVFLANQGFYNGLTWHRVIEGFMAQGGDPLGTGTGGAGYNVPAEFTNEVAFDRPGILAMARANDPNSASSQFFITTAPAPHLTGQYTVFGEVIAGQEIVDGIPLRDPMTATTPGEEIIAITIEER